MKWKARELLILDVDVHLSEIEMKEMNSGAQELISLDFMINGRTNCPIIQEK